MKGGRHFGHGAMGGSGDKLGRGQWVFWGGAMKFNDGALWGAMLGVFQGGSGFSGWVKGTAGCLGGAL